VTSLEAPFDAGLQPERTLLAWRRTALALALGCALVVRLTITGPWPVTGLMGIVGIGLSGTVYVGATKRYRRVHAALHSGTPHGVALPIAGLAGTALLVAVLGGVFVTGAAITGGWR
jgi:uncharacterized membrane protein YidH (DUF202 family)